jgi:hypothetical protein
MQKSRSTSQQKTKYNSHYLEVSSPQMSAMHKYTIGLQRIISNDRTCYLRFSYFLLKYDYYQTLEDEKKKMTTFQVSRKKIYKHMRRYPEIKTIII